MAWSSKTNATQLTSITTTRQWFTSNITLNPGETAHVQLDIDFGGTTDDMSVHVVTTLDDATENWDDYDYISFIVPNDTDPGARSFLLNGIYKARIGVQSTGATDTHTSADMSYRKDGVNV